MLTRNGSIRTVRSKAILGFLSHVTGKPNMRWQLVDPKDSKNGHFNSRLKRIHFSLKIQGCAKFLYQHFPLQLRYA